MNAVHIHAANSDPTPQAPMVGRDGFGRRVFAVPADGRAACPYCERDCQSCRRMTADTRDAVLAPPLYAPED